MIRFSVDMYARTWRKSTIKIKITNQYAQFFKFYFTNRVINNWNCLPSNIVLAGTLNSFKNLLDKHLKQNINYMAQGN